MLYRVLSDLHMNPTYFNEFVLEEMDGDHQTTLIVAGDVSEKLHGVDLLYNLSKRFLRVIMVFGNHDFYYSSIGRAPQKFLETMKKRFGSIPENFHLLDRDTYETDDTVIVGATLWTDYNNYNPISMLDASLKIQDFRRIRFGSKNVPYAKKLIPDDVYSLHKADLAYIKDQLQKYKESNKNIVVVTHHAPHELSVDPKYKGDSLNGAYYTDLTDVIENNKIDVWIHGHIHYHSDYVIHNTRVVCNPRGYVSSKHNIHEQVGFNPTFTIQL